MTKRRVKHREVIAALILGALTLSGCGPVEYHGYDSGIDGVLWRQIVSFEDPMNFFESSTQDPSTYVSELGGDRWDGSTGTLPDLTAGGLVFYDLTTTASDAEFSVFISSGPRPDVPTDAGHHYVGPSQVYTCYGITAGLRSPRPMINRTLFSDCPAALVNLLPDDAAFASRDVFDG
ncbi:hypothetical protein FM104_06035 [Microbacterium esteraromaticum]|uniref:Lipoprotein n=1 Tax=Microbacterium esteraromaticum TaxID=57043 RepID=A0A1R4J8H8_9MICO|nr:hypothetical protein [Microbacterium esteraromaticum]SJN28420.1 hypothetical protein FM104_06035 [Microbacterium esteraromaticum]